MNRWKTVKLSFTGVNEQTLQRRRKRILKNDWQDQNLCHFNLTTVTQSDPCSVYVCVYVCYWFPITPSSVQTLKCFLYSSVLWSFVLHLFSFPLICWLLGNVKYLSLQAWVSEREKWGDFIFVCVCVIKLANKNIWPLGIALVRRTPKLALN